MLVANLPEINDVRMLMQNLLEETGVNERMGETHAELFLTSMHASGATTQGKTPLDGTREITAAMFKYCRGPDPMDGLAAMCLGAEAIVPLIYSPVIKAMKHLGLPEEAQPIRPARSRGRGPCGRHDAHHHAIGRQGCQQGRTVREVANDMIGRRLCFLDHIWAAGRLAPTVAN